MILNIQLAALILGRVGAGSWAKGVRTQTSPVLGACLTPSIGPVSRSQEGQCQGVAQGLIHVFSVAGPSFHRPWAGRDAAEHPGIRRPVKAAPFSWAWIPGGPLSEWSPWGGRNTVAGPGSPLSDHAGWIFGLAGGINGQGLALGPAFPLPFGGQRPRSGHTALMAP